MRVSILFAIGGMGAMTASAPARQDLTGSFLTAAWAGQSLAVESALASGRVDINATTPEGLTALMLASLAGHEEIVDILLEGGADSSSTTANGEAALHLAAKYGFTEVAGRLIESGVNVNDPDVWGRTAWTWATWGENDSLSSMLARSDGDRTGISNPFEGAAPPVDRFEENPRISGFKAPKLPKSLSENGIDGTMRFDVVIDRRGKIVSIALSEGLHDELDAGTLAISGKWKFKPGRVQGKPVPSRFQVHVRFSRNADPEVMTWSLRWRR